MAVRLPAPEPLIPRILSVVGCLALFLVCPAAADSSSPPRAEAVVRVRLDGQVASISTSMSIAVRRTRRPRAAAIPLGDLGAGFELVIRDAGGNELHTMPFSFPLTRTVPLEPAVTARPEVPPIPLVPPTVVLRVPVYTGARSFEVRTSAEPRLLGRYFLPTSMKRRQGPESEVTDGPSTPTDAPSSARRLDVALVASDFDNMDRFRRVASRIGRYLLSRAPFAEARKRIRIHRIENRAPLGCAANCDGIDRLICCDDAAVIAAAGDVDEIIVVHNAPYGGSGLTDDGLGFMTNSYSTYAVTYGAPDRYNQQPKVAVHEFGHSFGNLCDEYEYGGDATLPYPCVNCLPACDAWANIDERCRPGCASRADFRRPGPSLMRSNARARFNTPSIRATYSPFGLKPRLDFFIDGTLPDQ